MRILKKSEWTILPQVRGNIFISIYLDTSFVRAGQFGTRNLSGFLKELINEGADYSKIPRQLRTQITDASGWLERAPVRDRGLALFFARNFAGCIKLPFAPQNAAHVGESFHVKTILSMFATGVSDFWVLRLGHDDICYYRCDEVSVRQVFRIGTERTALSRSASEIAHRVAEQAEIGMPTEMRSSRRPLVLAGPPYLRSRFRTITSYPYSTKNGFSAEAGIPHFALHQKATSCLEHHLAEDVWDSLSEYAEAAGRGAAVSDLAAVGKSLAEGKACLLFVAANTRVDGRFDPSDGRIIPGEGGEDILDDLAEEAARRNIRVISLPVSHMPLRQNVAAVLTL